MPDYTGEKFNNLWDIGYGKDKKKIDECPISYADWSLVRDSLDCYTYREEGFLPYHYDEEKKQPAGILDQTMFFHISSQMVKGLKNEAEAEAMKEQTKDIKKK